MRERLTIERMRVIQRSAVLLGALLSTTPIGVSATPQDDAVLTWNAVMQRAIATSVPPVAGVFQARLYAIMHSAMFDAVNGIERRYTSIHVEPNAPRGASKRAAAIQAAYTTLAALFPAQVDAFEQDLQASLDQVSAGPSQDNSVSIARGRLWGEQVALEILAWREADGLNPPGAPYLGSTAVGKWRPTPPAFAPGLAPTMATTEPFVIESPWSFRSLTGPPALTSQEYADSVNEVKSVGADTSITRTADQTDAARFWFGNSQAIWNRIAADASRARHLTLTENVRLFALLTIAEADAIISCWDAKYFFELWRPITAIRLADTDGNLDTAPDPTWTPLIATPPYPEYDSGHQSVSRSSATVLIAYFGDSAPVEAVSDGLPGITRHWANFTATADEASNSRIWAGIHFRFAMEDTQTRATQVAHYVLDNAAQPVNGRHSGQLPN
jgi:hypothetical protein